MQKINSIIPVFLRKQIIKSSRNWYSKAIFLSKNQYNIIIIKVNILGSVGVSDTTKVASKTCKQY